MPDDPIASVVALLNAVAATRDPALALTTDARRAAARLSELLRAQDDNLEARHALGWWHWYRYLALPEDEDQEAWDAAAHVLTKCFVADVRDLPEPLITVLAHYAADEAEDLLADAIEADDAVALATAATLWQHIVAATPPENPRLAGMLANLAVALQARHRWSADSGDLDAAIAALRRAVALPVGNSPGHTNAILSNLAGALSARFSATGHTDDLDETIQIMRKVMAQVPPGDPAHLTYQSNLSSALAARFERRGARPDLDEAVSGLIQAASTTVESDPPNLPTALSSLGVLVRLRFDRTGEDAALDLAVKIGRLVADALPPARAGRHRVLSNLAGSLRRHAERTGEPADFDEAIEVGREAVACTPLGHDDAAQTRSNLGDLLRSRYERLGDPDDLDEAIEIVQEVVASMDGEGPATATYLANLGRALTQRHRGLGAETDLERAVDALTRAASIASAPPSVRLQAARGAAVLIARRNPTAAASLLESAVVLVPRIASRHLGRHDQEFTLRESAGLGCDATAMVLTAALATRDPSSETVIRSLRLMELGRGVVLGQLLDARDDLADLRAQHPQTARRLTELRDELDRIGLDDLAP
jgi:hypothetical protein